MIRSRSGERLVSNFIKLTLMVLVGIQSFGLNGEVVSQPSSAQSTSTPQRSGPPSLNEGGEFLSLEGHFSIGLPKQQHGFQTLSLPTPFGIARGDAYTWSMKEAVFVVGYADAAEPVDPPDVARKVFEGLRDAAKRLAAANSGNVRPDKLIELGKYPGIEQRVDLFTGFMIQRTFLVSRRLYQTLTFVKTTQREFESVALKALDTFKLMSDSDIAAMTAKQVAEAEPSPLPQQPVAQRSGSDALDNRLRGKVKTVLEESQDLTGTWSVQTRKRDFLDQYNEQGNLVRRESYDYKGNLDQIVVYGYLDGGRVSHSSSIKREYNPPPLALSSGAGTQKSDPRYDYKFEFKYDDKRRLIEKAWFHNSGNRYLRYVYSYKDNQVESLVYSDDGKLNQRSVSLFDKDGNEVERTSFDPRDGARGATHSYVYEFDPQGNWTKRTTSKIVTKDGKSSTEALYVDYRTITYY